MGSFHIAASQSIDHIGAIQPRAHAGWRRDLSSFRTALEGRPPLVRKLLVASTSSLRLK